METRRVWSAAGLGLLWLAAGAVGQAQDVVRAGPRKFEGKIAGMTPTEVTVSSGGANEVIPVNLIEGITFGDEPPALRSVRSDVAAARYEPALATLEKIDVAQVARAEVKQEIEYYRAVSTARAALAGDGEAAEALKLLAAFQAAYPSNWRLLEISELAGELAVAVGQFAKARESFETLGRNAPWPEYRIRAAVGVGGALLGEKKIDEARKFFEAALTMKGDAAMSEPYRRLATLGKARCLAEAKQHEQALKIADEMIAQADTADVSLLAAAYNVKGIALYKASKTKDALYAFLHVETLYAADSAAHGEALYWLVQVWRDLKNPQRALETQRALEESYPESRFTRELKAAKR